MREQRIHYTLLYSMLENFIFTNFLEAASYYADRGLAVFPLLPQSKVPATLNGFKDATTNADQIQAWWSDNPHYNVAIATGNRSGTIVIDIDGAEGEESLATLEKQLGTLPVTITQITPGKMINGQWTGKGRHLIFRTNGQQFSCRTGIVKSIDIKADGGYIVAAPSVHPDGTGSYTFAEGLSFNDIEPAELPQSWNTWILAEQDKKKSKAPMSHTLPPASEAIIEACRQEVARIKPAVQGHGGDKKTFRVACLIFHDFGLSEAEGRPILEEYNLRCVPAWDERKLQHKINSAFSHAGMKPRGWKRSDRLKANIFRHSVRSYSILAVLDRLLLLFVEQCTVTQKILPCGTMPVISTVGRRITIKKWHPRSSKGH